MGSTGYMGLTAKQAKAQALSGNEILFSTGNWYAIRSASGVVFAVYLKSQRYGDEVVIKAITSDMGPYEVPGEPFYRRYLKATTTAPTGYETEWRQRCEATYAAKAKGSALKPGDTFEVRSPYDYNAFGRISRFTLVDRKRRIASIESGARVRLPRGWETNLK
jgi:hypothetical protein